MKDPGDRTQGDRRRVRSLVALVALVAVTCTDASDPLGRMLPVQVALTVEAAAGGPAEAYARADAIAVVVRAGGAVVFDETQAFSPETGETRVRVRLERSLAGMPIAVQATLLAAGQPVFAGATTTTLEASGPTTLDVPLTPVIARVAVADPVVAFTAIGERATLTAAAVFATGDTVPGVPITWRSLDPAIVSVASNGAATSQAEGTARVEATTGTVTGTTRATVVADVARVTVTPGAAVVSVGQSTTFTAQAFDRNTNVLTRTFTWTSDNTQVATVSATGVAQGRSSGAALITAAAGGRQGSASLTVVNVPIPPTNLVGTILSQALLSYRLTWVDASTNETSFSVERRVGSGAYQEIARPGAGTTTYQGTGVPGTVRFRVLACNAEGCSAPSNEVVLEFTAGPPGVVTLPAEDIGVMTGRVTSATPFTARFQYGYDPSDFEDNGECPCFQETGALTGTGTQEFAIPVFDWYVGYPLYYRIVAQNEFGTATGDLQSTALPDVATSSSSSTYDYGGSVALRAEIFTVGTTADPIAEVTFEVIGSSPSYSATLADQTASTSPVAGGRVHTYEVTWQVPSSPNLIGSFVFVDVVVTFKSGATAYAPALFLTLEAGEAP